MIVDGNGMKRSDAKPMYRKIPREGLTRLALALTDGSIKYDEGLYDANWKKATPEMAAACFDHAVSHLYSFADGDATEDHLSHAAANLFFLMEFEKNGRFDPAYAKTQMEGPEQIPLPYEPEPEEDEPLVIPDVIPPGKFRTWLESVGVKKK